MLLDQLDSPVLQHAEAAEFPPDELEALLSDGVLRLTTSATTIPRPARFGPGPDVVVVNTARGLQGVAKDGDYFDPLDLTETDCRQYDVSLARLAESLRRANGIEGNGFANHRGLIALGVKRVEGASPLTVYLSLPNHRVDAIWARCQPLLTRSNSPAVAIIFPRIPLLPPEMHRIYTECGVRMLSLEQSAEKGHLSVGWTSGIGRSDDGEQCDRFEFRKEGRTWALYFAGKAAYVPDSIGMRYIAELLRRPRVEIESATLAGAPVTQVQLATRGMPLADTKAIRQVKAALKQKREELESLQISEWEARRQIEDEIGKCELYLRQVQNNRGESRKVAGVAQQSRTSVTNAIRRAIKSISDLHPVLGRHLSEFIKTGSSPVYSPAEPPDWQM